VFALENQVMYFYDLMASSEYVQRIDRVIDYLRMSLSGIDGLTFTPLRVGLHPLSRAIIPAP